MTTTFSTINNHITTNNTYTGNKSLIPCILQVVRVTVRCTWINLRSMSSTHHHHLQHTTNTTTNNNNNSTGNNGSLTACILQGKLVTVPRTWKRLPLPTDGQ